MSQSFLIFSWHITTKSHFSILQGHQSKQKVRSVFCELQLRAKHRWLQATQQSIYEEPFKSSSVSLCAPSKYNFFNLFFNTSSISTRVFIFQFHECICKFWTTCRWVHHWRKVSPCPRRLIDSSNRGGTSWAHPQSVMECCQDQPCLSCAGACSCWGHNWNALSMSRRELQLSLSHHPALIFFPHFLHHVPRPL